MYEDKKKGSISIDWKSLLIKLGILLVAVFLILWIVSLFKKDEKVESNLTTNLKVMKEAATEYFVGENLPQNLNSKKKITLEEMTDKKLIIEFKDENGSTCSPTQSYAEATRINSEDYTIKVKLVCGEQSDYVINTVSYTNQNDDTTKEDDEPIVKPVEPSTEDEDKDEPKTNNTTNNSSNTVKPNTNNNSNSNSNNNNSNSNSNNSSIANNTTSCKYGSLTGTNKYPLAYKVSGCAVTRNVLYQAKHANTTTQKGLTEYNKLIKEINTLAKNTNTSLYVEQPIYEAVMNKEGTGYIGFQIIFSVKQKLTYTTKTVYYYYLNTNNTRTAIIDERANLSSSNNNQNIAVNSLTLNTYDIDLNINDNYYLSAYVYPTNANYSLNYSSSNSNVVSVSSTGKLTAKKAGSATITVTAGNKKAYAYVNVEDDDKYINIYDTNMSLNVNDSKYISYSTNLSLNWTSSNESVAIVTSTGKVTAKKAGTATITAKSGNYKDTVKITVTDNSYLYATYSAQNMYVGQTDSVYYETNMSGTPTFNSSNTSIVSVSNKGVLTAKKAGEATITVKLNGKTTTVPIKVTYTKTYYMVTYVDKNSKGSTITQYIRFNEISNNKKILKIDVVPYETDYDYMNYVGNYLAPITVYSGTHTFNARYFDSYTTLKKYSLKGSSITLSTTSTNNNGYYAIKLNTRINNYNNATSYNNGYLVPVKIMISYE